MTSSLGFSTYLTNVQEFKDENGKYHKDDGPAVVYSDKTVAYYLHGKNVTFWDLWDKSSDDIREKLIAFQPSIIAQRTTDLSDILTESISQNIADEIDNELLAELISKFAA